MLNLLGSSKFRARAGLLLGGLMTLSVGSSFIINEATKASSTTEDIADTAEETSPYSSAWQHAAADFTLEHHLSNPRVQHWIRWYQAHPVMFDDYAQNSALWLPYVIQQVEQRGMPGELALLPFIESGYNPLARSPTGPRGIWQLSANTASDLGLKNSLGYAARQDVVAATPAALDYLESLHERYFPHNWELTLAAYNAGPGRILQAQIAGKSNSYWSLSLSQETMDYVPKLLALAAIIANPHRYGIELPALNDNTRFTSIDLSRSLNLSTAARLAGVDVAQLRVLNPGYVGQWVSGSLLIPAQSQAHFKTQLDKFLNDDSPLHYVVAEGDTLSAISQTTGVSISAIRHSNQLAQNSPLRVGQTLILDSA